MFRFIICSGEVITLTSRCSLYFTRLFAAAFAVTACSDGGDGGGEGVDSENIVGEWSLTHEEWWDEVQYGDDDPIRNTFTGPEEGCTRTLVFNSDKTGIEYETDPYDSDEYDFEWSLNNNKLHLNVNFEDRYYYTKDYTVLTLSNTDMVLEWTYEEEEEDGYIERGCGKEFYKKR